MTAMSQSFPTAAPVNDSSAAPGNDSPCVAVCSTLFDDVCRGCGRTVMEVANWVFMGDAEKKDVWERITAEGYPKRNNPPRQRG